MKTKKKFGPVKDLEVFADGKRVNLTIDKARYHCYRNAAGDWAIYRHSDLVFTWHPVHQHITNILRLAL